MSHFDQQRGQLLADEFIRLCQISSTKDN